MPKANIPRVIMALLMACLLTGVAYAEGNRITSDLWIHAIIHTVEKGAVEALWQQGGEDTNAAGDHVIWGYFYADPEIVSWGSQQNPEVFVKIWFDRNGRLDVNYFHVSVPDIEVLSGYPHTGLPDEHGTLTLARRYVRHYYENGQSHADENYEDGNPAVGYWRWPTRPPAAYPTDMGVMIAASINTKEKGPVEAIWRKGGEDTHVEGHRVIWGHFYASPDDVPWGSQENPEIFAKMWFDASGRADVNFFHVSVPDIRVYSDFPYDDKGTQDGMTLIEDRYVRHEYQIDPECPVEEQNKFVYDVMKDTYLWSDKVPEVDHTDYPTPQALLDDLKYRKLDKWSYVTSSEEHGAYFDEGEYLGLGFRPQFDDAGDCRIIFVYEDSPAEKAGLQRGDRLLEINDHMVSEYTLYGLWEMALAQDADEPVKMTVADSDGPVRDVSMNKEWIAVDAILHDDILDIRGTKIGYLVFNAFVEAARGELDEIFALFRQHQIDELVLDLRYNQGGELEIARYLASLIAGTHVAEKVFAKTVHNDKHRDWDDVIHFVKPEEALSLDRLICVTTGLTASASELVINGLRPFMEVVSIGETTSGKPVGMHGWDFCDIHVAPVEFRVTNADDEGDYFDGLLPTCQAGDDLTRMFGDLEESALKGALHYATTGSCLDGTGRSDSRGAEVVAEQAAETGRLLRNIRAF